MAKKNDWMKKSLMGSTTMPMGTGDSAGGFFLSSPHVHAADGSCCGHDHAHGYHHDHGHHRHHGESCAHDHDHDEDCTSPKGGCC
jgi:hypothetical protein